ncbi:hypothetical protein EDEG_03789 [Edhazardia aedis USNM 41457]|uniref:Uncharacterized protein n=1 Tax=Edhazardia aedis (strain USNM 41457) TaxID=1003232 RepID=J9DJY8_EDHAE|nr:hypothetical protein EDEG_03789 [Edhazardia aedis USNM 41457]|eukprot:EJW01667.1 hypothetical protein EDEG_03789 [Edhazardia aedis USNM 41457]
MKYNALRMILLYFLDLYFCRKIYPDHDDSDSSLVTKEEYRLYECTKDPMTYIVEIKIHTQLLVAAALQAIYAVGSNGELNMNDILLEYFGEIFDELNLMLLKYKVQLHMNLDSPIVEEFMTDMFFDPSCEMGDPVLLRTADAFKMLKAKYKNSIGLHLFVWVCPKDSPLNEQTDIQNNDTCGRVMGVLWRGSKETKDLIINTIIKALTGVIGDFTKESSFNSGIQGKLCSYVNKCLARNATDIGQKVFMNKYLSYLGDVPID